MGLKCNLCIILLSRSFYTPNQTGHHETETCYEGESDLEKHETECKKNPGHERFFPLDEFNYEHIPQRYQDVIVKNFINSMAALTVKVKVTYISNERPKRATFYAGDYPFYKEKGASLVRYGTGRIDSAFISYGPVEEGGYTEACPCELCKQTGAPLKRWGEITVITSKQLVFDDDEVRSAQFFLEWADKTILTLDGFFMKSSTSDEDRAECVCLTHDLELREKLGKMTLAFQDNYGNVKRKYIRNNTSKFENVVFIVSYPHGKAKKVSVGQVIKEITWKDNLTRTKYSYTAPTCPGSSGAPVFVMGYNGRDTHTHAGTIGDENFSGECCWFSHM